MSTRVGVLGLLLASLLPAPVLALCNDPAAVATARTAALSQCNCATAFTHGAFVKCVDGVATQRVHDNLLPPECRRSVVQCASRSTCGRPGFVACCRTRNGVTKCSLKRTAAKCVAPTGGAACAGPFASCCDACGASGCATTTSTTVTTTTSSTSTTIADIDCAAGSAYPTCDGTCDPGLACMPVATQSASCKCLPVGSVPCGASLFPMCAQGVCPGALACGGFEIYDPPNSIFVTGCGCLDPTVGCYGDLTSQCVSFGYCPVAGQVCVYTSIAPHATCPCCGCGLPF